MKVLVLGSNGNLGAACVVAAVAAGHEVTAVCRTKSSLEATLPADTLSKVNVVVVEDFTNAESLSTVLQVRQQGPLPPPTPTIAPQQNHRARRARMSRSTPLGTPSRAAPSMTWWPRLCAQWWPALAAPSACGCWGAQVGALDPALHAVAAIRCIPPPPFTPTWGGARPTPPSLAAAALQAC